MNDSKRMRDLERLAHKLGLKLTRVENGQRSAKVYFTDGTRERFLSVHRSPSYEVPQRDAKHLRNLFNLNHAK